MSRWRDKDGFLHIDPSPSIEQSENGPTFTAEDELAAKLLGEPLYYPRIGELQRNGKWYTTRVSTRERFSHDSQTGVYVLEKLHKGTCKHLPVIFWGRKGWFHPRDIAFYLLMKENKWVTRFLGLPLLLFLLVTALVSCREERARTSGKCLWWLRLHALQEVKSGFVQKASKLILQICERILKKQHGEKPWIDVFSIYFKNPKHPLRKKMEQLYD